MGKHNLITIIRARVSTMNIGRESTRRRRLTTFTSGNPMGKHNLITLIRARIPTVNIGRQWNITYGLNNTKGRINLQCIHPIKVIQQVFRNLQINEQVFATKARQS